MCFDLYTVVSVELEVGVRVAKVRGKRPFIYKVVSANLYFTTVSKKNTNETFI